MLFDVVIFVIALLSLVYGVYTDIKKRTINSFIFIPLVLAGTVHYLLTGANLYFALLGLLVFFSTYVRSDIVLYPILGIIYIVVSFLLLDRFGVYLGFHFLIMAVIFLVGFQEKLFGIGDIKALVAVLYSFTSLPFITVFTANESLMLATIPLAFAVLINVAIASLLFYPYLLIYNKVRGNRLSILSLFSIDYDEKLYEANKQKFHLRSIGDKMYLVYRTPFMVPITIGFIITAIFGMWFFIL